MGHEDDDRHEKESAPHTIFQDLVLIEEDVFDGHQWNVSVKNVKVINQLGCQLIRLGGGRKKYCSVSVNGREREQHQTSDGQIH